MLILGEKVCLPLYSLKFSCLFYHFWFVSLCRYNVVWLSVCFIFNVLSICCCGFPYHTHTRIAKEIVSAAQTFAVIVIINVCCRDLLPSRNSFFAIVGHRRNLKPTYVAASFIYSSYRAYR